MSEIKKYTEGFSKGQKNAYKTIGKMFDQGKDVYFIKKHVKEMLEDLR